MLDKLENIYKRYKEIETLLMDPEVSKDRKLFTSIQREIKVIKPIVNKYQEYIEIRNKIKEDIELLEIEEDEEIKNLAKTELKELEEKKELLLNELKSLMIPKDKKDEKNAIVEIRAGTGGEEAALFAKDLFRMYSRYAERMGWKVRVVDSHPTDLGGFKEIVSVIEGNGVYGMLKFESGVHRVQRVPTTESGGRIHTSTATVAVLPEVDEVDITIDNNEIKMEFYNASGPGGQNVNKVATAVRLIHIPTGIVVTCQEERSQYQNRLRAMEILRAKIYSIEKEKRDKELKQTRRSQIGTGERSEKIRTYNFPQNRVTDHRINLTSYNLDQVMDGYLDTFIDKLHIKQREKALNENS